MDIALKAAETGHLVLSTLHTPDVTRTINRVLALS
jgi:twitching motility protein PilT